MWAGGCVFHLFFVFFAPSSHFFFSPRALFFSSPSPPIHSLPIMALAMVKEQGLISKRDVLSAKERALMEQIERREKLKTKLAQKAKARGGESQQRMIPKQERVIAGRNKETEYNETMRIYDRVALERRAVHPGALGTRIYDAVFESRSSVGLPPPFRITVPALSENVVLRGHAKSRKASSQLASPVSCGEVMMELRDGGGHEPVANPKLARVVSARAWITVPAEGASKQRPLGVQCSVDNFASTKKVFGAPAYAPDGSNDPAKDATCWSMLQDGDAAFDAEMGTPVSAYVMAAQMHSPELLHTRFTGKELNQSGQQFFVDQPGVVLCTEDALLGSGAEFADDNKIVAVIDEHHAFAITMLFAPTRAGLTSLRSFACGTLRVGTDEEAAIASEYRRQACVFVVPFLAYRRCMTALRDDSLVSLANSCEMGQLQFRLDKSEMLADGETAVLSVVTKYVVFDVKPSSLLLRRNAIHFGEGWKSMKLIIGDQEYADVNKWREEVETLWRYLKSLLRDNLIDLVPFHQDGHTVNFDRLANLMKKGLDELHANK